MDRASKPHSSTRRDGVLSFWIMVIIGENQGSHKIIDVPYNL
jgi:hypothetical protein